MPLDDRPDRRKPVIHRRESPPPPVVRYEDVIAACGHPEKFGLFEDRLDRFRHDRRKKLTDRPCRACRERKRLEEEAAAKVRKAEKQERQAVPTQPKMKTVRAERLPDGAKVEATYDAGRTQWRGTLTVGDKTFTGSASGLFKLLQRLDEQYWQTLPPEPSEVPVTGH